MLRLGLITLLALVGLWMLRAAVRQIEHRLELTTTRAERIGRLKTLVQVGHSAMLVALLIIAAAMALQALDINVAPLLAGAGIAGLALSLGAQTLIKDFIGGFLIFFEDQFTVGDVIQVGEVSGTVEEIGLRATRLRDIEGKLHIVPNGDIRTISNVTADWSQAIVNLNVDYQADMNRVMSALEAAAKRTQDDAAIKDYLLAQPQALGWIGFSEWAMQVRLMVKTQPGKQWQVMTAMRQYAVEALRDAGVTVAVPTQRVRVEKTEV